MPTEINIRAKKQEDKHSRGPSKLEAYMGFASKAGKLLSGSNTCICSLQKGKVKLLIIASDVSANMIDKMESAAKGAGVDYRICGEADRLAHCTGRYGHGVFAVTDNNFAKVIAAEIDKIEATVDNTDIQEV